MASGDSGTLERLYAEQFAAAREEIDSWPEDDGVGGSSSFARQNLDQNPEPFLGFSMFLDLRLAHPLGDSMVKFRGSQIQAASVSYYHFEFVQALARLILIYGIRSLTCGDPSISYRCLCGYPCGIYALVHLTRRPTDGRRYRAYLLRGDDARCGCLCAARCWVVSRAWTSYEDWAYGSIDSHEQGPGTSFHVLVHRPRPCQALWYNLKPVFCSR